MILSIFTTKNTFSTVDHIVSQLKSVRNLSIKIVQLESHPDAAHFLSYRNVQPNQLPAMFLGLHHVQAVDELLNIRFPDDLPETDQEADNKSARTAEKIIRRELNMPRDIRKA